MFNAPPPKPDEEPEEKSPWVDGVLQLDSAALLRKEDDEVWLPRSVVFKLGIHTHLEPGTPVSASAQLYEVMGWSKSRRAYWLRKATIDVPVTLRTPPSGG